MQPLILPPQSQPLALPNNRLDVTYYLFLQAIRDAIARGAEMVQFGSAAARKAFNTVGLPNAALWFEDDTGLLYQWRVYPGVSMGWVAVATVPHVVTLVVDGGGSVIPTGDVGFYPTAKYAGTIVEASISADQSGSCAVDIWKKHAAIPSSSDKVSASAPVTLSGAQLNQSSPLTGWNLAIAAGDVFGFSIASAATVTRICLQIWYA